MDADGEVQLKETESDFFSRLFTYNPQVNMDTLRIAAWTHLTNVTGDILVNLDQPVGTCSKQDY